MKRSKPQCSTFGKASTPGFRTSANNKATTLPGQENRILIAGIGNIFMGDDGFGCEVARALSERDLPTEVKVQDFGIRSYDLAYALTDEYEAVILVDAISRRQPAGTLFLIEPHSKGLSDEGMSLDAHTMNPLAVLQMAERLGGIKGKLYLVGCVPKSMESDEGQLGLTDEVERVVPQAVAMIERLVNELLQRNVIHAGKTPV